MKETIKYYYGIYPNHLEAIDNGYYFYFNDIKYYFVKYDGDINNLDFLIKVSNELYNKNILVDTFIENKFNSFYVEVDEKYVLLKVNSIENDIYNIKDIIWFNNSLIVTNDYKIHLDWATLWMKKVDDFENEISEFNNEYNIIRESFNYYVGLAENAISYFKDTIAEEDISSVKININHKRLYSIVYSGFINNPLTFTFDYDVRDLAEYLKSSFFDNKNVDEDIYYIVDSNYSKASLRLLFSRMLYPSYYFDILEKVLIDEKEENELQKYIDKSKEYEQFLKFIYETINKKYKIPLIEWINSE